MAPDARRASGTYYTPASLVGSVLDAAFVALLAGRLRCAEAEAERRLAEGAAEVRRLLRGITLLDPAAGSGAFLLGALERLTLVAGRARSAAVRRRILERNLFGVDRNPAAVRLTELRLWLAVVASDPSEDPTSVQPLPNLDCLIRQGDSLFDPVGSGLRPPPRAMAAELARLRGQVVVASGPDKRRLVRELTGLEARVAEQTLDELEERAGQALAEVLARARERDLFGRARGLDRGLAVELSQRRTEVHRIRRLRRGVVRGGAVPWFHYQVQFADVFAGGGFDLVVGNPPWLRAEAMDPELRARLAARYRWWRRGPGAWGSRPDVAVAFLERSVQLTRPGGVVAMLVPAKIARATYGAEARHALATTTTLVALADLTGRPEAAFDATVYPLALVARHARPPSGHRVRARLAVGGPSVRQAALAGGGPWILTGDRLQACLAGLRAEHPPIGAVIRCQLGVKTGANRVFLDPPLADGPLIWWAVRGRDLCGIHGPCPPPPPLDPRLRWLAAARAAAGGRSLPGPASRRAASEGGSRRRAAVVAVPDPRRNSSPPCRLGRRGALALGRRAHGPRGCEAGAAQQLLRRAHPRRRDGMAARRLAQHDLAPRRRADERAAGSRRIRPLQCHHRRGAAAPDGGAHGLPARSTGP